MGIVMKSLAFLLCCIAAGPAGASDAVRLSEVRAVYLLPMAGGLDQFLANRLTTRRLFQVVTDPKKADAIFTDQLGGMFEARFEELYPPPQPPKPEEEKVKPGDKEKEAEEEEAKGKPVEQRPVRFSTFGRGKGTIFLVDVKSRAVIWSTYEKPDNSTSRQLDRTAERITDRLKRDLKGK